MSSNNSYDRYREYRQNRRRYEMSVGAIPAIFFLVILAKILPILKGIFILLIVGVVAFVIYQLYKRKQPKTIKVELDELDKDVFEIYCMRLFELNDFINVRSAKLNINKGVDIIAEKDGESYAIKCIISPEGVNVDADSIRNILNGCKYFCCDKSAIITNRHFTSNAITLSQKENVILWDRQDLIEFLSKDSIASVYKSGI